MFTNRNSPTYFRDQARRLSHKTGENQDTVMWRDGSGWYITGRELDEEIRKEIEREQAQTIKANLS